MTGEGGASGIKSDEAGDCEGSAGGDREAGGGSPDGEEIEVSGTGREVEDGSPRRGGAGVSGKKEDGSGGEREGEGRAASGDTPESNIGNSDESSSTETGRGDSWATRRRWTGR